MYPAYGNLVPRDIATRAIFDVCINQKLGINGENMVYLDLSHKDPHELDVKLGGILEIYEKFTGDDPRKVPMKIFPAVHYSMGGLWVDFNQMTNIPGLFACGEVDYQYHGANRLGANSLLSSIFGGMVAGPNAVEYINNLDKASEDVSSTLFDQQMKKEQEKFDHIMSMDGNENPYQLHKELGEWMTANVTVVRENDKLLETDEKIQELMERYQKIGMVDQSKWANQTASFTRQLWNMLQLARVITIGAYHRNESRGGHYKPEFPDRNDEEWLKTTRATFNPEKNGPDLSYEDVDVSFIKPRVRDYSKDK
jgi:succinate dehydrogenase / fumarate reductase flavoprotein subunit